MNEGNKTTFTYRQLDWALGIPQTSGGDLKMVTAWKDLGFVVNNYLDKNDGGSHPYVVIIDADDPANKRYLTPEYSDLCKKENLVIKVKLRKYNRSDFNYWNPIFNLLNID